MSLLTIRFFFSPEYWVLKFNKVHMFPPFIIFQRILNDNRMWVSQGLNLQLSCIVSNVPPEGDASHLTSPQALTNMILQTLSCVRLLWSAYCSAALNDFPSMQKSVRLSIIFKSKMSFFSYNLKPKRGYNPQIYKEIQGSHGHDTPGRVIKLEKLFGEKFCIYNVWL